VKGFRNNQPFAAILALVKISSVSLIKFNNFFSGLLNASKEISPDKGCIMSKVTPESLKEKAKLIRSFINEKSSADVSHSHCLELASKLFGFHDWNTASAVLKSKPSEDSFPVGIKTVGDLKKALESFKDTDTIDADYTFQLGDILDDLGDFNAPDDEIFQEFSLSIDERNDDIVNLKLKLEHESISESSKGPFYWIVKR
jgi:hypothetical protein